MPNNFYQSQEESTQATPVQMPQPPDETTISNEVPMSDNTTTGQLVVTVFTASQLYPVVGAQVSVTEETSDEILSTSTTDRSGRTTLFTLPAPSATMSQEPTIAPPFAEYKVTIRHPDFFEAVVENVQLFGGIITQLPVNLIPLPELAGGEPAKIVIIPRQNL